MQLHRAFITARSLFNFPTAAVNKCLHCTVLCGALFALGLPKEGWTEPNGHNVIQISIDDLKTVIGALADEPNNFLSKVYPDKSKRNEIRKILTPNIDALAARSLLFTNAHAAMPLCNPSRVALLTGVTPNASGVTQNEQLFRKVPGGRELTTIPQHLKSHGYFTTGVGKFFHRPKVTLKPNKQIGSDWPDSLFSWSHWVNRDAGSAKVYTKAPYSQFSNMRINFGQSKLGLEDEHDIINAKFMGELLSNGTATIRDLSYRQDTTVVLDGSTPFYIGLGILLPHEPFVAPKEILSLFNTSDMEINDENLQEIIQDVTDLSPGGKGFATTSLGTGKLGGDFQKLMASGNFLHGSANQGDILAWKNAIQHYLAAVAVADRSVGYLLRGLESSPYASNTIIVLHSDHGFHLGEKNRFGKNTLWDEATGSVLIIHKPNGTPSVINSAVSLLDIYPTIMSLTGIEPPDTVHGEDLSVFFDDPIYPKRSPVLTVHGGAGNRHAIRTDRYRYIRFKNNTRDAELYDTFSDPYSLRNLINSPEHQTLRVTLDSLLNNKLSGISVAPDMLPQKNMLSEHGAAVRFQIEAWHAHSESIEYTARGLPPGLTVNSASGVVSGTVGGSGQYFPTFTARSLSGNSTSQFSWEITTDAPEGPPTWEGGSIQVADVGHNYLELTWSDIDRTESGEHYMVFVDGFNSLNVEGNSVKLTDLDPETEYYIEIQSVNNQGDITTGGPGIFVSTGASTLVDNEFTILLDNVETSGVLEPIPYKDENTGIISYNNIGKTATLIGNHWKRIPVNYEITKDTVLEFNLRGDVEGKTHAVGFETDNIVSYALTFQLWGNKYFGRQNYKKTALDNQWSRYVIPVGKFLPSKSYKYFTLISDKGNLAYDPKITIDDVRIYNSNTANNTPSWLPGSSIGLSSVNSTSATINWPAALSGDLNSTRYSIYLNGDFFKSTRNTNTVIENLQPSQNYNVDIIAINNAELSSGETLATQFFTLKEDLNPEFLNILVDSTVVSLAPQSFGAQDRAGDLIISDGGSQITLEGNKWQYVELPIDITEDTVIEFDFQSNSEGHVHGIALEKDLFPSSSRVFKLFGSKNYGIRSFDYYDTNSHVVHYSIPVGKYFTGSHRYLVLVSEQDSPNANAHSAFSNIEIKR